MLEPVAVADAPLPAGEGREVEHVHAPVVALVEEVVREAADKAEEQASRRGQFQAARGAAAAKTARYAASRASDRRRIRALQATPLPDSCSAFHTRPFSTL